VLVAATHQAVSSGTAIGRVGVGSVGSRYKCNTLNWVLLWDRAIPGFKIQRAELIAKGKPKKVAIIAATRKLIVNANALLRENMTWDKELGSVGN